MFWKRLLSFVVLIAILAVCLYFGGVVTGIAVAAVSFIGVFEMLRVYKLEKSSLGVVTYIATAFYYIVLIIGWMDIAVIVMTVSLLVYLAIYVIRYPKYNDKQVMTAFLSFFYVPVMFSYVYLMRAMPNGGYLVVLIFLAASGNDTFAYLVGVTLGKHKMFPELSPKKSVEGFIGGVVGATILGMIFGYIYSRHVHPVHHATILFGAACLVGSLPAVIGDLAASAIKRNNNIKDFGNLIPGHGGIMDRIDSILFTAPIMYYVVTFVIRFASV